MDITIQNINKVISHIYAHIYGVRPYHLHHIYGVRPYHLHYYFLFPNSAWCAAISSQTIAAAEQPRIHYCVPTFPKSVIFTFTPSCTAR